MSSLASLVNVITFHSRTFNAKGCNGPCNHEDKTDIDTLYDYDDLSLPSSDLHLLKANHKRNKIHNLWK